MPHSLRTPRLLLRPMIARDAPVLCRAVNHFDVLKMTGTWPYPITAEYARYRITNQPAGHGASGENFGIFFKGELIGSAGGGRGEGGGAFTIGYMLGPDWAGRGLATEALAAICAHFRRTRGLGEIIGERFFDNPASGRVMEKVGFVHVGPAPPTFCTARNAYLPGERYVLKPTRRFA